MVFNVSERLPMFETAPSRIVAIYFWRFFNCAMKKRENQRQRFIPRRRGPPRCAWRERYARTLQKNAACRRWMRGKRGSNRDPQARMLTF